MEMVQKLDGYLYDEMTAAEKKLQVTLSPHSKVYVLDLLKRLAKNGGVLDSLPGEKPLAAIMLEAMHKSVFERIRDLRRIGDLSLVFSGLYPEHLTRRLVEVDYFISLGKRSYHLLSRTCRDYRSKQEVAALYLQLCTEFLLLTEILTEMAASMHFLDEQDPAKAVRRWRATRIRKYLEIVSRYKVVPI